MIPKVSPWIVLALACALGGDATGTLAQEAEEREEYEVKAAFLYRFTDYVTWSEDPVGKGENRFVIGVLGKDPFGEYLDRIAQARKVKGKDIVIQRFKTAEDYKPCHILFVSGTPANGDKEETAAERLAAVQKKVNGSCTLVVGDTEGLARKGAVINFYLQDRKMKFEVNPGAAKRAKLQISSQLYRIGRVVNDDKP